jgi:hypothetical protein
LRTMWTSPPSSTNPDPAGHTGRRAGRIVAAVERQLTALDDHDAGARMRVPPERPSRCDLVLHHVDVGRTLGVDAGLPVGARASSPRGSGTSPPRGWCPERRRSVSPARSRRRRARRAPLAVPPRAIRRCAGAVRDSVRVPCSSCLILPCMRFDPCGSVPPPIPASVHLLLVRRAAFPVRRGSRKARCAVDFQSAVRSPSVGFQGLGDAPGQRVKPV